MSVRLSPRLGLKLWSCVSDPLATANSWGADWHPFFVHTAELLFFWTALQDGLLYLVQVITEKCKVRSWKPCRGLAFECIRLDMLAGSCCQTEPRNLNHRCIPTDYTVWHSRIS